MNVLLTTLNTKFIHTNLAIRYLREYVRGEHNIDILEFTINQDLNKIIADIHRLKPQIVGFSTYIWNINETLIITKALKLVNPNIKIILGGPEVSFNIKGLMHKNPQIDYIVYNEGEETFKDLINALYNDQNNLQGIFGLAYRHKGEIYINPQRDLICNLEDIPFAYDEEGALDAFKDKIIYYESTRGCPFNCKYCLSSTISGVRYLPMHRVKKDISKMIDAKVKQVKFVDRTFNANKKSAMEIMKFIMEEDPEDINFHFEISAHIIDDEMLAFLKRPKEGLFQFEIGVQSTNSETTYEIMRTTDFARIEKVSREIRKNNNIHQHLDLIAGLPYEDYDSFSKSFNDVYSIKPEKIQLGFLKLLKGSQLRIDEEKYGYKYLDIPPYEIMENDYISYDEIIRLKFIEELVDKYYNEGYFKHSLAFIIKNFYKNPFEFYEEYAEFWIKNNLYDQSHSRDKRYEILYDYYMEKKFSNIEVFLNLIKYDYIKNNRKNRLPQWLSREKLDNEMIHWILKDEAILDRLSDEYQRIPTKKLLKTVDIEHFTKDIYEIIENDYTVSEGKDQDLYILFHFVQGKLIGCNTYDITNKVKEFLNGLYERHYLRK